MATPLKHRALDPYEFKLHHPPTKNGPNQALY
jgi:hypothetical protein